MVITAGGGGWMGWFLVVSILLLTFYLLRLPVRVHLTLRHLNLQALLLVEMRYLTLRWTKSTDLSHWVSLILQHIWKRWRATGEPVDPDFQESWSRFPGQQVYRLARPVLRYLGRPPTCSQLRLRLELGGLDASQSALLTGVGWSGAGMLVSWFTRWLSLDRQGLEVHVLPNYKEPIWRTDLECILSIPLGKAIKAIIWLLYTELSRREVLAWVRDSLRRKGDQRNGRPPDSRPDEDGHGDAERYG